jgi:GNAT superfamily N-acetyltransferase
MSDLKDFKVTTGDLQPEEFIRLSKSVGWGVDRNYDMKKVAQALEASSLIISVRSLEGEAVACGRVFSDDLLMTFIPDLFVDPHYQNRGFGRVIIEKMKERYGHTLFFFGSQEGNEGFFEKLGFKKSLQSYEGSFRKNPYF